MDGGLNGILKETLPSRGLEEMVVAGGIGVFEKSARTINTAPNAVRGFESEHWDWSRRLSGRLKQKMMRKESWRQGEAGQGETLALELKDLLDYWSRDFGERLETAGEDWR